MAEALDRRGGTPLTLFKIIVMLGLVLAGVAAFAAEPEPTTADAAGAGCARTSFEFGGRIIENGEATDTWTLTCWRTPPVEAGRASMAGTVPAKPVAALPVTTLPAQRPSAAPTQF